MLILHHLNNSRSQRILWLLEELGIPYEIKRYERTALQQAPKELFDISPLGKSPVITDGNITLAESGAIIEYIISRYGGVKAQPSIQSVQLDNLYFTHYAEGSLMPVLVQKFIYSLVPKNSPFLLRPILNIILGQLDRILVQPELEKHIELIESHLTRVTTGWFAGGDGPTAADYQMIFPLEAIVTELPELVRPKMVEYVKKVQDRPAYKRGIEKGGEYKYIKS